jgi:hypothetical protein
VSVLEGEGLFNDVTAITLYHVAIAAAVTGTLSIRGAVGELVLSAFVAAVVVWRGGNWSDSSTRAASAAREAADQRGERQESLLSRWSQRPLEEEAPGRSSVEVRRTLGSA